MIRSAGVVDVSLMDFNLTVDGVVDTRDYDYYNLAVLIEKWAPLILH